MSQCNICVGEHTSERHIAAINAHNDLLKEWSCQCGDTCPLCRAVNELPRLTTQHPKRTKH